MPTRHQQQPEKPNSQVSGKRAAAHTPTAATGPHTPEPGRPAAHPQARTRPPRRLPLPSTRVHSNAPRRPFRACEDMREGRRLHQDVLTMTPHPTIHKTPAPPRPHRPTMTPSSSYRASLHRPTPPPEQDGDRGEQQGTGGHVQPVAGHQRAGGVEAGERRQVAQHPERSGLLGHVGEHVDRGDRQAGAGRGGARRRRQLPGEHTDGVPGEGCRPSRPALLRTSRRRRGHPRAPCPGPGSRPG